MGKRHGGVGVRGGREEGPPEGGNHRHRLGEEGVGAAAGTEKPKEVVREGAHGVSDGYIAPNPDEEAVMIQNAFADGRLDIGSVPAVPLKDAEGDHLVGQRGKGQRALSQAQRHPDADIVG